MTAREYDREGAISRFSLDRRITVLVLFLATLVVGTVAAFRIPVELIPSGFSAPHLSVRVPWQDAPAQEVMEKITIPLEDELSTVRGISSMTTVSVTGRGLAFINFKQGTDMDVAYREVRDRVERARTLFPDDIDKVSIGKDDASGIPAFLIGVAVDESLSDSYNLIQNEVILPLSRIDGVATVSADGLEEKEILIELDRKKTASAGLNIFEMASELGGDNFSLASGTVRDGSRKLLLRSLARYDGVEDLKSRPVGSVRLGDIATITYDEPDKNYRVRAMSKPAVAVVVMKEGEANIRDVSKRVEAAVEKMKNNPRMANVETVPLFNQGDVIDEALSTLLGSGAIGGVLAAIVMFVFLRRFRLTLIITLGIPLSLVIGLTVMYFAGESLNLLTLLGLMLCVGLLVDNSVVVAENIHRLHREGAARRDACIHGAGEVALAITMSTLTTLVVFLPVALVAGPGQFFLLRLALPVCVSVAASLLVALVFIPLCVYLTLPVSLVRPDTAYRRAHDKLNDYLRRFYDQTFGRLNQSYSVMLAFFMRRRLDLIVVLLIVFGVSAAVPFKSVKVVDSQDEERSGFQIQVEMPQSTTLEEAEEWFLKAEKVVEDHKEEWGLDGWFHFHRTTFGEIQGWFTRPRSADLSPAEVTELALEALPKRAGFEFSVGEGRDTEEAKGNQVWSLVLRGENADVLDDVSEQIEEQLARVEGVLGPKGGEQQMPNELSLVIDREKSQRYGVNPQAVAGVVGSALRGSSLPKYRDNGREIPVRIRFQESDRESLSELADFSVPTASGDTLPLASLVESKVVPTSKTIVRRNKQMGRIIMLELEDGTEEETRERLTALSSNIDLPEGITVGADLQAQSFNEDLRAMMFALLLSVVFIYLLMGFLFESFVLPLSIVLTIPLSSIGVYWIHFLAGYDLDFLGFVAIIILVGVVVNNGIVLIDYVNRLRAQGMTRQEALLAATGRRFRPIMMTAITTIGGMVPLALAGANSIGLSYTSFALTLIGGMTTATLLTLLVVPIFYTFFDDAGSIVSGWLRSVLVRLTRRTPRLQQDPAGAQHP